jgi:hypothetical protein
MPKPKIIELSQTAETFNDNPNSGTIVAQAFHEDNLKRSIVTLVIAVNE